MTQCYPPDHSSLVVRVNGKVSRNRDKNSVPAKYNGLPTTTFTRIVGCDTKVTDVPINPLSLRIAAPDPLN